ncbi:MAG: ImmA/IrrE family metallo-endopeptidase, partial [Candidatus Aminicenantes bacterium]|nr:ImmA/IrrE family metallo-endopeptidase [Candidatus Aminicenantes bacterium]
SAYLNKDVGSFFRESQPVFSALLVTEGLAETTRAAFKKFRRHAERYLELEATTNRRLEPAPLYANISAERLADGERRRLGLGQEPIRDIFGLCEVNGLRLLRQPLPEEARISGVFVFLEERNAAFGLINAASPVGHQVFAAAHLYAHYLKDRLESPIIDSPDVIIEEYVSLYSPREQSAQAFAARFLMPPAKVQELLAKELRSPGVRYEDVLFLKRYFGVSTAAMLRRLRGLGVLPRPRFEEFFRRDPGPREREIFGNIAGAEERAARAGRGGARAVAVHSDRFRLLAAEAQLLRRRSE